MPRAHDVPHHHHHRERNAAQEPMAAAGAGASKVASQVESMTARFNTLKAMLADAIRPHGGVDDAKKDSFAMFLNRTDAFLEALATSMTGVQVVFTPKFADVYATRDVKKLQEAILIRGLCQRVIFENSAAHADPFLFPNVTHVEQQSTEKKEEEEKAGASRFDGRFAKTPEEDLKLPFHDRWKAASLTALNRLGLAFSERRHTLFNANSAGAMVTSPVAKKSPIGPKTMQSPVGGNVGGGSSTPKSRGDTVLLMDGQDQAFSLACTSGLMHTSFVTMRRELFQREHKVNKHNYRGGLLDFALPFDTAELMRLAILGHYSTVLLPPAGSTLCWQSASDMVAFWVTHCLSSVVWQCGGHGPHSGWPSFAATQYSVAPKAWAEFLTWTQSRYPMMGMPVFYLTDCNPTPSSWRSGIVCAFEFVKEQDDHDEAEREAIVNVAALYANHVCSSQQFLAPVKWLSDKERRVSFTASVNTFVNALHEVPDLQPKTTDEIGLRMMLRVHQASLIAATLRTLSMRKKERTASVFTGHYLGFRAEFTPLHVQSFAVVDVDNGGAPLPESANANIRSNAVTNPPSAVEGAVAAASAAVASAATVVAAYVAAAAAAEAKSAVEPSGGGGGGGKTNG